MMVQATGADEQSRADAGAATFRLFRPGNAATALGLAVSYLVTKPAFANLRFGDWTRILIGQINRKHYYFAVDGNNKIKGFMGWALATNEHAEAWLEGGRELSYQDSLQGDCLIFNAWAADSTKVHRFLVDEARKIISDKQTVYFRRYYKDGSVRAVRLNVNDFVGGHISRQEQASTSASS